MEPSFKVICATRASRDGFATQTALGRSLALFPHPFIELELHAGNRTGLATLYNAAIDRCRSHPAYLVFAHDDVHLLDLFWPHHVMQGLKRFDVIGAVGNRMMATTCRAGSCTAGRGRRSPSTSTASPATR